MKNYIFKQIPYVFYLVILTLTVISCAVETSENPPLLVGRGRRMLVIRYFDANQKQMVDLTFFDNNEVSTEPRLVDLIPTNYSEMKFYDVTSDRLNEEDWNTVNNIRNSWCDDAISAPQSTPEAGERSYTVGIDCQGSIRVLYFSQIDMSSSLKELLLLAPRPSPNNTVRVPNINSP